jgi:hypothetical protein
MTSFRSGACSCATARSSPSGATDTADRRHGRERERCQGRAARPALSRLINLHDHPSFDVLPTWLPPSSDAQPAVGKAGTDPHANLYRWGADGSPSAPPEERRLVANPEGLLNSQVGLRLSAEVDKYAEA